MADYTLTTLGVGDRAARPAVRPAAGGVGRSAHRPGAPRHLPARRPVRPRRTTRSSRSRRPPSATCCASTACCTSWPNVSVPVVDAFGTVIDRPHRDGEELGGLLITRHLPFSLPYRSLFTGRGLPQSARPPAGLAGRAVRPHPPRRLLLGRLLAVEHVVPPRRRRARRLPGRRRDRRAARPTLTDGQRNYDITIATENIAGELFDLQAAGNFAEDVDPVETAMALAAAVRETVGRARQRRDRGPATRATGSTSGSNVSTTWVSTYPSWRSAP